MFFITGKQHWFLFWYFVTCLPPSIFQGRIIIIIIIIIELYLSQRKTLCDRKCPQFGATDMPTGMQGAESVCWCVGGGSYFLEQFQCANDPPNAMLAWSHGMQNVHETQRTKMTAYGCGWVTVQPNYSVSTCHDKQRRDSPGFCK